MNRTKIIANQFREVYLTGKWVVSTNLMEQITALSWKEASHKVSSLNTIAAIVAHLDYYIDGVLNVFDGGTLDIRDKYSFSHPPVTSKNEWNGLLNKVQQNAERFASMIDQMSDETLNSVFVDEKYGTYERNIHVIIEHGYYHLGQIVLIKKIILEKEK
jgi:uncharacterized damage-inducible protein DinB